MKDNIREAVDNFWEAIQRSPSLKPYAWMGSGWRTGSAEHVSGRAIEIPQTPGPRLEQRQSRRPSARLLQARREVVELHEQRQREAGGLLQEIRETDLVLSQLLGEESGPANLLTLRAAQRLDRDIHGSKSPEVLKMPHQVLIALTKQVQRQCQVVQALATRILN